MHDDIDVDWTRLARYFAGECSPDEAAEIERWAAAAPGRREELTALEWWWKNAGALPSASRIDTMWQQLAREMRAGGQGAQGEQGGQGGQGGQPGGEAGPPEQRATGDQLRREARVLSLVPARPPLRRTGRAVAAIAAAAVVAAGTALVWRSARETTPVTAERAAPPMREYATARGQRAILQLTDGTRIDIGVDSRLRVPADFASVSREVYLEGEAYFDAAHDDRKPFIVHTARGTARDIGTKFGVRAYADDDVLAVVVSEGAVALTTVTSPDTVRFPGTARAAAAGPTAPDSVILTEADVGRLDAGGRLSVERNIDVDAYLGWTKGRLVFANAPLREVIPRLNRWYDIDVRLGDRSLGDVPYTASLKDEPLPQVLRLLAASLDVRVERAGKIVTLHARRPR